MKRRPKSFRKSSKTLKNNKGLKVSSARWLQRQLNDPFVQQAKAMGLRSRAAFKLMQIQEKYKIIKKGDIVVDLGAAPGGWAEVAADLVQSQINAKNTEGAVFALDLQNFKPIKGVEIIVGDFTKAQVQENLIATIGGKINAVISDMAPSSSGHKKTDHIRIMGLAEEAFNFAKNNLVQKGCFVAKIFQGGMEPNFSDKLKACFKTVAYYKPEASRKESNEMYIVAKNYF